MQICSHFLYKLGSFVANNTTRAVCIDFHYPFIAKHAYAKDKLQKIFDLRKINNIFFLLIRTSSRQS